MFDNTTYLPASVTRLGDLLDFGQLFKACGNNEFAQISPTFLGNFCKGVKIFNFTSKIIFGNFYRHLGTFSGHTASYPPMHLNNSTFYGPRSNNAKRILPSHKCRKIAAIV